MRNELASEIRQLKKNESAQKASIDNLNIAIQELNNALNEKEMELSNTKRQLNASLFITFIAKGFLR